MKTINLLFKLSSLAFVILFFVACSGSGTGSGDPKTAISSFIRENTAVVAFGSADINEILNKADYQQIPKLGMILSSEMSAFKNMIDMSSPVYYAIEGPMDREGVPTATYAFLKVNNADSLVTKLIKMGYDVDEKADIKIGQDDGFAIGVRGGMAIVIAKKDDFDAKDLLEKAFKMSEGDPSGGKVDEILASEGDIVMGLSIAGLYGTSNTELSKLSDDKQKELDEMVIGSYVQTSFKFEDGAAVIETKNFFSDKLKEKMFMNSDDKAMILAKLGKGEPRMGVSVNIDIKKMQKFMDDFSPEATDKLAASMGGPMQFALMAGGKDKFAGLLSGKFGFLMFGDGGFVEPSFNAYVGLKPNGVSLGKMAQEFLESGDAITKLDDKGFTMYSNPEFAPPGKLKLPAGCENFGKSGFSAFLNLDGLDFDDMGLEREENFVRIIKYITVDYNNDGGRIYIKARDGKENILEQAVKEIMSQLTNEIGGMAI